MKKYINKFLLLFFLAFSFTGLTVADEAQDIKTITFFVKKMTCAVCPITVKTALKKLDGVIDVASKLETKTATVTFDKKKVSVKELIDATTNAGYPSVLVDDKDEG